MIEFNPAAFVDARARSGLTQRELSDKSSVSLSIISRYERGIAAPTARTAHKLASALDVDRLDFYTDSKKEAA